ncbi:hypothetical protein LEP1GSC051_2404 [Leptospira sp. P2653]|nr:hypothetical protein LEP1GSC051_2404 [Leptospira sp. P2653]
MCDCDFSFFGHSHLLILLLERGRYKGQFLSSPPISAIVEVMCGRRS